MRITAGEFRSRTLSVPDIDGLRPTSSRVREALFNILGDIEGWRILDLFSGSGIMAIEALSRGAEHAISIEQDRNACQYLRPLAEKFHVEKCWQIQQASLPKALDGMQNQHFDWIFADPPYDVGMAEKIPLWLQHANITTASLVIEESVRAKPQWPQGWKASSRRYGDTNLYFLEQELHS
ncbi:MAG: 16S rRNA (guanine(966)-N(2))-methyltransferase RsmD [Mariprofundaceae bacterium]|nr:16S rRNA (guanine(966)-N(2))-methyltransferase RsmD [Mariprofundaceae bacterium]